MQRERERVDGAGDHVRPGPGRLERVGERGSAGALAVEADRKPGRLLHAPDELARLVRLEAAARVVHKRARGLDLRQLTRLLDEFVHRALVARAVDESRVELFPRGDDRLARLAEVGDVVERIVQAEDVDPVFRCRGHEAAHEVGTDGAGTDEEAAAQGEAERRRRARLQRPDPLPRTLDAAADGRVEDTAAGHLEQRKAGAVEQLPRSGAAPRSGPAPQAAPARAGEWWCRRAAARAETTECGTRNLSVRSPEVSVEAAPPGGSRPAGRQAREM